MPTGDCASAGCAFLILLFAAFLIIAQRIAARQISPFKRFVVWRRGVDRLQAA